MGLKTLIRALGKIALVGVGGLLGALAVVWAGENSDWITIRLPAVMVPGSDQDVEYEARAWGVVAIAFGAGIASCFWIVLATWARSVRRERRLAKMLERLEAQVKETHQLHLSRQPPPLAQSRRPMIEDRFDDFDELEQDSAPGLLVEGGRLPIGYDEPEADGSERED